MANSYATLGKSVGNSGIMAALTGGATPDYTKGYAEGTDLGSKMALRDAQATNASVDTQKVLDALKLSQDSQAMSGEDLYTAGGGQSWEQAGPMQPGVQRRTEYSDPKMLQQMNLTKALHTLSGGASGGGNVNSLVTAINSLQDRGAEGDALKDGGAGLDLMARLRAAREGKDRPDATGARSGSVAADVQMMKYLQSPQGGGLSPEQARQEVLKIGGNPGLYKAVQGMMSGAGGYNPDEVQAMLPILQQLFNANSGGTPPPPPGNIVKVYKN